MSLDLLLCGGRVVDGTGSPWFHGAVGIVDGQIEGTYPTADAAPAADRQVDVDGAVIAPGFIDTHSHSALQLFADPTLEPKIRQGITTEVVGQDGFSMAPIGDDSDAADRWADVVSGLAGRTDQDWTWRTVEGYLDAVEANGVAPNIATLVGHGAVRFSVLGMADRAPTTDELETMADQVNRALDAGALGLSTALVLTPCSYAETAELERLAAELVPYGRPFVAHIRSERDRIWSALDEFIDIGADVGVPLHLSHFKLGGPPQHGKADRALALVEAARDRGVDFTADQYPYTASSTMLTYVLPPWVHADGPAGMREKLQDPTDRQRLKRDITEYRIDGWDNPGAYSGWDNVVVANVATDQNRELEGDSIATIAEDRDLHPVDAVCDLLLEEDLEVSITNHFIDEDDVREILRSERVNVITDGLFGGRPHPRVYGAFPRVLGKYVREENLLTLEEAIRKMTSLPARAMGLDRKGLIRPGMDADLTVFDTVTVAARSTYDQPKRFPDGIHHVLVDGSFVVEDGSTTGTTPGAVIRGG